MIHGSFKYKLLYIMKKTCENLLWQLFHGTHVAHVPILFHDYWFSSFYVRWIHDPILHCIYDIFIMHENRFLFHFCHYLTLPNVKNLILEIKGLNENNIYELFFMEYEVFWKIFEFVKEIRLRNQTEANTN